MSAAGETAEPGPIRGPLVDNLWINSTSAVESSQQALFVHSTFLRSIVASEEDKQTVLTEKELIYRSNSPLNTATRVTLQFNLSGTHTHTVGI